MTRRRLFLALSGVLAIVGAGYFLTAPNRFPDAAFDQITGDAEAGERVFRAAGCASCHAAPDATRETRLILAGGRYFKSPFGTFYAPNISSDPVAGIGNWSTTDLANALIHGTSPANRHLYPALPYTTYIRADPRDIADLRSYLATLPADPTPSRAHDLAFPFNIRAGLGLWKALFLRPGWVITEVADERLARGRYLVEALGHCGECHTPRNILGGLVRTRWLAGAPNPNGPGTIPNITPAKLDWSDDDLLGYFTTGFKPDFDTVGGEMAEVVENLSALPEEDLRAIIAYLRIVAPVQPAP